MNKVILIGNLGRDPEIRYTPSGTAVANFSIVTTERYTDKSSVRQEKTEWHNLVAWNRTAEIADEYLQKGSKIGIEGKLQTRQWEDKDGNKRSATEVIVDRLEMLGSAPHSEKNAPTATRPPQNAKPQAARQRAFGNEDISEYYQQPADSDIPF